MAAPLQVRVTCGADMNDTPLNPTHRGFEPSPLDWRRTPGILSGENAVRAGIEKYLPQLDSQTDQDSAPGLHRALRAETPRPAGRPGAFFEIRSNTVKFW